MKNKSEYSYVLSWSKKIKAVNLLGGKCKYCGENRPWLLNFHHKNQDEKEIDISKIRSYRWSKIEQEVLKCDLFCYNCHREIHSLINREDLRRTKQKNILFESIKSFECNICGYNKTKYALDFHHIHEENKKFSICELLVNNKVKNIEELELYILNEINKCQILCSNCHQDLHFDKEKFEKYKNEIKNWDYKELQPAIDKDLVIKMYNDGMKQTEIAKKLKCAKSTICGIIKNNNRLVV